MNEENNTRWTIVPLSGPRANEAIQFFGPSPGAKPANLVAHDQLLRLGYTPGTYARYTLIQGLNTWSDRRVHLRKPDGPPAPKAAALAFVNAIIQGHGGRTQVSLPKTVLVNPLVMALKAGLPRCTRMISLKGVAVSGRHYDLPPVVEEFAQLWRDGEYPELRKP